MLTNEREIDNFIHTLKTTLSFSDDIAQQRSTFSKLSKKYDYEVPHNIKSIDINNSKAFWVSTGHSKFSEDVIIFLHGGGFSLGETSGFLGLISRLSHFTKRSVLSIDYPLIPENPFPSALNTVISAYKNLLDKNIPPKNITLSGITAGANLALASMIMLRDNKIPLPKAALLFALPPYLDFSKRKDQYKDTPDWINYERASMIESNYINSENTTYTSPGYADLQNLPPMLVQVGTNEITYQDALDFTKRAQSSNTKISLEVYDHMIHAWHMFPNKLKEADLALQRANDFLNKLK